MGSNYNELMNHDVEVGNDNYQCADLHHQIVGYNVDSAYDDADEKRKKILQSKKKFL